MIGIVILYKIGINFTNIVEAEGANETVQITSHTTPAKSRN